MLFIFILCKLCDISCDISFCTSQKKESHMEWFEDDLHQNKDLNRILTFGLFITWPLQTWNILPYSYRRILFCHCVKKSKREIILCPKNKKNSNVSHMYTRMNNQWQNFEGTSPLRESLWCYYRENSVIYATCYRRSPHTSENYCFSRSWVHEAIWELSDA